MFVALNTLAFAVDLFAADKVLNVAHSRLTSVVNVQYTYVGHGLDYSDFVVSPSCDSASRIWGKNYKERIFPNGIMAHGVTKNNDVIFINCGWRWLTMTFAKVVQYV